MARIGTSWGRIQPGDIISFNYKGKTSGKQRLHTILVLNPKYFITDSEGQRVFQLIGLKLAEQRVRTIREVGKIVNRYLIGCTLEAINEKKDIYRIRMKKQDMFWGGAKDIVYRRIRYLLGKEPIYRTYDWEIARKSPVFYEALPLPEGVKRQILGAKTPTGERVLE